MHSYIYIYTHIYIRYTPYLLEGVLDGDDGVLVDQVLVQVS